MFYCQLLTYENYSNPIRTFSFSYADENRTRTFTYVQTITNPPIVDDVCSSVTKISFHNP